MSNVVLRDQNCEYFIKLSIKIEYTREVDLNSTENCFHYRGFFNLKSERYIKSSPLLCSVKKVSDNLRYSIEEESYSGDIFAKGSTAANKKRKIVYNKVLCILFRACDFPFFDSSKNRIDFRINLEPTSEEGNKFEFAHCYTRSFIKSLLDHLIAGEGVHNGNLEGVYGILDQVSYLPEGFGN